ncbi:hypothetical protein ACQPYE_26540 [Actinosynnema sp. CA-299493]
MAQTALTIAAMLVLVISTATRIPPALTRFINSLRPLIRAAFALRHEIRTARAELGRNATDAG